MVKISSLLKKLANKSSDYPHLTNLTFVEGEIFSWNHTACAISYDPAGAPDYLLHEFAHALLGHTTYRRDVQLLEMERDAWKHARLLADEYRIPIDPDLVEDSLDTYRNWLHARALCPSCDATGLQEGQHTYRCIACRQTWRVNDARTCSLRRYPTK
jgi:hypothetical protein